MEVSTVDLSVHNFSEPVKAIKLPNDIQSKWEKSQVELVFKKIKFK